MSSKSKKNEYEDEERDWWKYRVHAILFTKRLCVHKYVHEIVKYLTTLRWKAEEIISK